MKTNVLIKRMALLAVFLCSVMSLSSYAYHDGYYGPHYYRSYNNYYGPRYHHGYYYGPRYYSGYYSSYYPRYHHGYYAPRYYGPRHHNSVRVCHDGYCFYNRY